MFREMRRKDREISREESYQILLNGIDGILGTVGENGYPYTVPVNYAVLDNKIYFHSALVGHKLDNIKFNNKVSFTVVSRNEILSDKFSTNFQSVIVFGKANLITPSKEILFELIKKYSGDFLEKGKKYINNDFLKTQLVEIEIEHITGKQRT